MRKFRILSLVFNSLKNDNRVFNQAFSLSKVGYEVVLVGILGIKDDSTLPFIEEINGVSIIRKRMISVIIERIKYLRVFFFILNSWVYFFKQSKNQFDFIHCHDLDTLEYGVFMKFLVLGKVTLFYDAHEYETQRNGLHGWRWAYVKLKERFLIKFCDRVITVSPTIADEYVRLYGIEKPEVILNCPVLRTKKVVKRNFFRDYFDIPSSKMIFLYQGYLYPGRGIEIILEAFNQLNLPDCVLVFMGEGTHVGYIMQNEMYGKSVFLHPLVSGEVLLGYTSSADCGLAFIEDISLSDRYCLPNKLFEYIAAGLPVISSGLPDLRKFINMHQVGVSADSNDVEGFIKAFRDLLNLDSKQLAHDIERTRALFNWGTQEKLLINLYSGFVKN
jgi:glycosyltransferase involved in cell wall biosynthesis